MSEGQMVGEGRDPDGAGYAPNAPAGYRRTEVRGIPEDWDKRHLRTDISLLSGHHVMARDCNSGGVGVPYLTGPADFPDGQIRHTRFTSKPTTICRAGDILVTVKGSGSGTLVEADAEYCISRQLMAIRPTAWNPTFLRYSLLQNASRIKAASTGLIPGLSRSDILDQPIPIPSRAEEQRAIAAVLSDVDELIGSLEALIAKKRAIKQAAMQQLLTGRTRLPGFGGEWEVVALGQIGETYGGLAGKTKADFGDRGAHYIAFLDVLENVVLTRQRFDRVRLSPSESQHRVMAGDVLFNATSETPEDLAMGSMVIVDAEELYLNSFCFGFRIADRDRCDPLFLAYLSRGVPGRTAMYALAQGATRHNLSKARFLMLEFPLPPLPEQRAIATVLSDMDAEIAALERRLNKTRAIKQGMMQQLLTGSIRLPIPEADMEDDYAHDA